MVNNLPTLIAPIRAKKILLIFLIGIFIGAGGGASYYFFQKKEIIETLKKKDRK